MADDPKHRLTLRQLEIFWAVAHAGSLTRAAKQLDMRQPSISQQIGAMEKRLGGKLIRFVGGELRLTPAGQFLLDEARGILGALDRTEVGLSAYFGGRRGRLSVGALPSLARNILAPAVARMLAEHPGYVVDVIESTPREAIEQLSGRSIDLALITGYAAAARLSSGLRAVRLTEDRQLLAVPPGLPDLTEVRDPARELDPAVRARLGATVRYAFGSEHSVRVNRWYDRLFPGSALAARCRSYETALALVERGLGAALVPELAVHHRGRPLFDIGLYALPLPAREIMVLVPDHYLTLPPLKAFLGALREAAGSLAPLPVAPVPAFAALRLGREDRAQPPEPSQIQA